MAFHRLWLFRSNGQPRRAIRADRSTYRHRIGFTLVELLLVVAIIGTLAGIAAPNLMRMREKAQIARAIGEIRTLQLEIVTYQATHGWPPNSLADIDRAGYLDPWGRPYQYLKFSSPGSGGGGRGGGGGGGGSTGEARKDRFLVPINSSYDLYSLGKDGKSVAALTAMASHDDIILANDGGFIGLAADF